MLSIPETPIAMSRGQHLLSWGRGAAADGRAFDGRAKAVLLVLFAALVILRLPEAWHHGRFLDEEGSIFFAFAWHRPAVAALFRSFGGYLNIGANATALVAARLVQGGMVPLALAPYVTMAFALAFQLMPALLILTGRAPWLTMRWSVLGSLLIVASAPMTEEVFGNVLHIQFHLALCAALILALDIPRSRWTRAGYGVLLFLAPLCGPGAIVLTPLYALRTLVDRSAGRLVQTVVLGAATALQLVCFFEPSPLRGQFLDPITLAAIMFVRLFALPFLTAPGANAIGRLLYLTFDARIGLWLAGAAAIAYFAVLTLSALRDRRDGIVWLVASGLMIGAMSFGGGMIVADRSDWFSVGAGERYNFLPLTLLGMAVLALALRPGVPSPRVWKGLVLLSLLSAAVTYPLPIRELSQGPEWRDEVAAWRGDHDRLLAGWPSSWTVDLSDRDRPCSPPLPIGSAPHDPGYCESAWLAHVAGRIRMAHEAHVLKP